MLTPRRASIPHARIFRARFGAAELPSSVRRREDPGQAADRVECLAAAGDDIAARVHDIRTGLLLVDAGMKSVMRGSPLGTPVATIIGRM